MKTALEGAGLEVEIVPLAGNRTQMIPQEFITNVVFVLVGAKK